MADDLERLVTLERLGSEEAWIGEHFTSIWENIPCPDLFIAQALAMTRTMKLGTGVSCIPMSINIVPPRILTSHWEVVESSAKAVGRTADRGAWRIARDVYIAETTDLARREVLEGTLARDWQQYFLPLLRKMGMLALTKVDPEMPDDRVTLEYLLDNIWIVGDPDLVTDKLQKLKREVGGFGGLLVIGHEWQPREPWLHSMTILHDRVLPHL
jgi:alkanesulfonate monooxygenase SsuD/methylene tetrahydromethanopterin reductase-like flavin-dependent oxidoreductase (luciferase family)